MTLNVIKKVEKLKTTSFSIEPSIHKRLRRIALRRAEMEGGRSSVSWLLQSVIKSNIEEWEKKWPGRSSEAKGGSTAKTSTETVAIDPHKE